MPIYAIFWSVLRQSPELSENLQESMGNWCSHALSIPRFGGTGHWSQWYAKIPESMGNLLSLNFTGIALYLKSPNRLHNLSKYNFFKSFFFNLTKSNKVADFKKNSEKILSSILPRSFLTAPATLMLNIILGDRVSFVVFLFSTPNYHARKSSKIYNFTYNY